MEINSRNENVYNLYNTWRHNRHGEGQRHHSELQTPFQNPIGDIMEGRSVYFVLFFNVKDFFVVHTAADAESLRCFCRSIVTLTDLLMRPLMRRCLQQFGVRPVIRITGRSTHSCTISKVHKTPLQQTNFLAILAVSPLVSSSPPQQNLE